jgi:hypothetical protein
MSQSLAEGSPNTAPNGLIDTIQSGFNITNHHLWLLLLPLVVDLFLWLGPQLTIGNALSDWPLATGPAQGALERMADEGEPGANGLLVSMESLKRANLLWLLAVPLLGIPSFRAGAPGAGITISLDSPTTAAVAAGAVIVMGFSLAVVFYGLLAQIVRTGRTAASALVADFGVLLVRALGMVIIAVTGMCLLALPIGFLLTGALNLAPALITLLASLILGVAVWLFVHLFFAPDALFVGLIGPIAAVKRSVSVVRHFFWESVLFVGLIVIIMSGFPIILHELARNLQAAGVALAIVGHIYISTSVTAATMTYYRERFERLQTTLLR